MGRIIAIDYGTKRTGIATTDPLRLIATALETVATPDLLPYLKTYLAAETVDCIVLGEPKHLSGAPADLLPTILKMADTLRTTFPAVEVALYDERFTSRIAFDRMLTHGLNKKARQDKGRIDRMSAVVILEDYLTSIGTCLYFPQKNEINYYLCGNKNGRIF
jgi:putative holliday junction resolvase